VQHALYHPPYEQFLQAVGTVTTISNEEQSGAIYQAGFQVGITEMHRRPGDK
jgi:hypothetical protein